LIDIEVELDLLVIKFLISGQRFAMLELKASVSKVVRNFQLLPCEKSEQPRISAELVLISSNGINLRVKERK